LVLLIPRLAAATLIQGTFETTVNSDNYDLIGAFGSTGTGVYTGLTLRVDFEYDTSLAPPDTNPDPAGGRFESSTPWLVTAVTLAGTTLDIPAASPLGNLNVVTLNDGSSSGNPFFGLSQFSVLPNTFIPDTSQFFPDIAFVIEDSAQDIVSSQALPTTGTIPLGEPGTGFLNINELIVDSGGNPTLNLATRIQWEASQSSLTLMAVPEPNTALLLGTAFLALAGRRRLGA
jgi:hypothetical protein